MMPAIFTKLSLLFPFDRTKPSANGISIGSHRSEYDRNSTLAERFALLILVGLAVEIAAVFILQKPWLEGLMTIGATTLILIGVWGELRFEKRAREAGDRIVAEAEARAAEAQLELAKFRSPRVKLLTSEAVATLVGKLKPFSGTKFDIGLPQIGREQWDFVWQLEPIFPQAGWIFVDWIGPQMFPKFNWTMQSHIYGLANVSNVDVELNPQNRAKLLPAAEAFAAALNDIGIVAAVQPHPIGSASSNADAIHVLIGTKE